VDHRFGLWTIARNAEQAQKLYGSPKTPRNESNCTKIEKDGQSSHIVLAMAMSNVPNIAAQRKQATPMVGQAAGSRL
jgi:hypothetical protein